MTSLSQTVPARSRTRLQVRLHAWTLHRPTHMQWTPTGRLLCSEYETGVVRDVTKGGDARDLPVVARNLAGPASILGFDDYTLVAESRGDRVTAFSDGRQEPFAEGLRRPYSVSQEPNTGKIVVSEDAGLGFARITDITEGRSEVFCDGIPAASMNSLDSVIETSPDWELLVLACPTGWNAVIDLPIGARVAFTTPTGMLVAVPPSGGTFSELLSANEIVAWGLGATAGFYSHPFTGLVYVTQPRRGTVLAVDPSEPRSHDLDIPVFVAFTDGRPSCVRFSQDGEEMLVCDQLHGVIYAVRGFAD